VSSKSKLILGYFLTLTFTGAAFVALHLEWILLVILFLLAGVLSGWKLNPLPQTSHKEFWRSRIGKICGVLLVLVCFTFIFLLLGGLLKLFALPGWLVVIYYCCFCFPVLIITFIFGIKHDLNVAEQLDKNKEMSG
jgi:hypothetical protein